MAASLPPTSSSTPATPSGPNPDTNSKPTMTPSTGASAAASPAKSGSLPAPEKEEAVVETSVEKSASSKNKRRRDRKSKPKPKPKKQTAQCVGYYVDALDKKMLWGEARIIQCNLTTQKIKVHFVGWSKNYDLWTDPMSITAHGRYAPRTKKEKSTKSWDGDMHLFEDMLGTIEEATFTPVPVPAENTSCVTSSPRSSKKKTSEKKKAPVETKTPTTKPSPARQRERPAAKRKAAVDSDEKTKSKDAVAPTTFESNGHREEPVRSSKRTSPASKEKEELLRISKRQKREVQQPVSTTAPTTAKASAKARPSKEKKVVSPADLPLFRELELDDGTVLDFSRQREEARAEREAMKSFLDKCAMIWKKQLTALSVQ